MEKEMNSVAAREEGLGSPAINRKYAGKNYHSGWGRGQRTEIGKNKSTMAGPFA